MNHPNSSPQGRKEDGAYASQRESEVGKNLNVVFHCKYPGQILPFSGMGYSSWPVFVNFIVEGKKPSICDWKASLGYFPTVWDLGEAEHAIWFAQWLKYG